MVNIIAFLVCFLKASEFSITPFSVISDTNIINENSGLLRSRKYDIVWTFNDSGDTSRIFAIKFDGSIIKPNWVKKYSGINIYDAHNVDWEAMTYDDNGDILIIDAGNNYNYRRDLAIYRIREPNPYLSVEHGIIAKYPFEYPSQRDFPDEKNMNFDCEAGFVLNGSLCLITKTRSTTVASLYCFDKLELGIVNIPKKIAEFDFKNMVTDASISPNKNYLAVLTYSYLWLFDIREKRLPLLFSKYYVKDISLGQCEGITFLDEKTILVSNEEGYLFKIAVDDIISK